MSLFSDGGELKIFVFIILIFISLSTLSSDWCTLPKSDSSFKYYLGQGSLNKSKSQAIEQAFENSKLNAIRDNFGTTFQVYKKTIKNDEDLHLNFQNDEVSRQVFLKDFEIYEHKINDVDNLYEACVVTKYSIDSIEEEKRRIKGNYPVIPKISTISFGVQNEDRNTLLIETSPSNAKVFIQNEAYGRTPVRLEQIPRGEIEIRIEKENYQVETIKQKFMSNETKNVNLNLKVAKREINIRCNADGAKIKINNIEVGTCPVYNLEYLTLDKLLVEITQENMFPYLTEIDLKKTDLDSFEFNLIPKKTETPKTVISSEEDESKIIENVGGFISDNFKNSFFIGIGTASLEPNQYFLEPTTNISPFAFNLTYQLKIFKVLKYRFNAIYFYDEKNTESSYTSYNTAKYTLINLEGQGTSQNFLIDLKAFYFGVGSGHESVEVKFKNNKTNNKIFQIDKTKTSSIILGGDYLFESGLRLDIKLEKIKNGYKYFERSTKNATISFGFDF